MIGIIIVFLLFGVFAFAIISCHSQLKKDYDEKFKKYEEFYCKKYGNTKENRDTLQRVKDKCWNSMSTVPLLKLHYDSLLLRRVKWTGQN